MPEEDAMVLAWVSVEAALGMVALWRGRRRGWGWGWGCESRGAVRSRERVRMRCMDGWSDTILCYLSVI